MNKKGIIDLTIKAFAIYLLVQAFITTKYYVFMIVQGADLDQYAVRLTLAVIIDILLTSAVAWIMFTKSERIALRLCSDKSVTTISVSKTDASEIVLMAVGVYLIVTSIPPILAAGIEYVYFAERESGVRQLFDTYLGRENNRYELLVDIVTLVGGFVLALNSRLISLRLNRIGIKDEALENE